MKLIYINLILMFFPHQTQTGVNQFCCKNRGLSLVVWRADFYQIASDQLWRKRLDDLHHLHRGQSKGFWCACPGCVCRVDDIDVQCQIDFFPFQMGFCLLDDFLKTNGVDGICVTEKKPLF